MRQRSAFPSLCDGDAAWLLGIYEIEITEPQLMIIAIREPLFQVEFKIELGEHGSDLHFPRARAPEYSAERGQAYLLSSERVQELPCRSGRHVRFEGSDSNRNSHHRFRDIFDL